MGTQRQTGLSRILRGTLARILVASLLTLLAWPVIYMGIFVTSYVLFQPDDAVTPSLVLFILTPVFVVLGALGTLLSFRSALITAAALALYYLNSAFTVYLFPGLLPSSAYYWTHVIMVALLSLNLVWMVWSRRKRAVAYR